jgi:hypothetical protein
MEAAAAEGGRVPDPVGHDEQQRHGRHRIHEDGQVLLRAGVDPMEVLNVQDQRANAGPAQGHGQYSIEKLLPAGRGVHGGDCRVVRVHPQQVADRRDVCLQLPHPAHAVLDLGNDLGLAVEFLNPEVLPELLDQGEEWDGLAEGNAPPLQPGHRVSGRGQRPATLHHEPRLADAGLPGDAHHLAPPLLDLAEAVE